MTLALPRSKSRGKFCCLSIARHLDKNEARGFAACILAHGVVAAEVTAKQCQSNPSRSVDSSSRQEIAAPRSRWAGRTGIPGRRSGRPSRPPLPLLLHLLLHLLLLLLRHSSPVRSRRAMHVTSTDHHRRTNGRGDQPPPPPPAAAAARRRPTALSERKQCQAMLLILLLLPGQGVGGAPCLRRRPRSSSSR